MIFYIILINPKLSNFYNIKIIENSKFLKIYLYYNKELCMFKYFLLQCELQEMKTVLKNKRF